MAAMSQVPPIVAIATAVDSLQAVPLSERKRQDLQELAIPFG